MLRGGWLAWSGYGLLLAGAVYGVGEARRRALADLAAPAAQAEWNEWREETKRLSETPGPVKRRPAKSSEPPLLVLLRDHYAVALGSILLTGSMFYWFLVVLLRGAATSPVVRGGEGEPAR